MMRSFCNRGLHFRYALMLSMIMSIMLAGCAAVTAPPMYAPTLIDGQVTPVQLQTALNGMIQAMSGMSPASRVYQDPTGTRLLFTWPLPLAGGQGWVFVGNSIEALQQFCIDKTGGNLANVTTWTAVKGMIESQGWTVAGPAAIAPLMRIGATVFLVSATTIGSSLPSFFAIPVVPGGSPLDALLDTLNKIIKPGVDA